MRTVKTNELQGAALDWAVAKCEGSLAANTNNVFDFKEFNFSPSTNWAQGGPIIERDNISITSTNFSWWECDNGWYAHIGDRYAHGPTPLIAAMRCYVASKLGDTIEIPEELT